MQLLNSLTNGNGFLVILIACITLIIFAVILFLILKRSVLRNAGMRRIDNMSGEDFEKYLYGKFKESGQYKRVQHTGQSGDYGADLILYNKNGKKIIVQAKRYRGYVGIAAVQEVNGARSYYNADEAWVVTNSTFSDAAKNLAASTGIKLFDRSYVQKLAQSGGTRKAIRIEDAEMAELKERNTQVIQFTYKRTIYLNPRDQESAKSIEAQVDEYLVGLGYGVQKRNT